MTKTSYVFKYKPESLEDMILTDDNKARLKKVIEECPSVLLYGLPGIGKSTFADILINTTGYDTLRINASDENNIETVRAKIKQFATTMGMTDLKIVYLNEMDAMSLQASKALRQLIEDVQAHTRFIMTCNYVDAVPDFIMSRSQAIDLGAPPRKLIFKKCVEILKSEGIKIEDKAAFKKSLSTMINDLYPDVRRIINSLEISVVDGMVADVTIAKSDQVFDDVLDQILAREPESVQALLKSNPIHYPSLYNHLYSKVDSFSSPGKAIIQIGEHLYKDSQVAIKEINFMAMVMRMIVEGTI